MYYDDDYDFYEPTEGDRIFEKAKEKLKECIVGNIKNDMNRLKVENEKLKELIEKYRNKEYELKNREQKIEQKENELEEQFYRKKFSEILKPFEEIVTAYRIDHEWVEKDKCDKCNENRLIEYVSKHGDKVYHNCSCRGSYKKYIVDKIKLKKLSLFKANDGEKEFIITPKYDSEKYDDRYCDLKIKHIFKDFNLEEIENIDDYDLTGNCIWINKEDCQKCCDFLNRLENN